MWAYSKGATCIYLPLPLSSAVARTISFSLWTMFFHCQFKYDMHVCGLCVYVCVCLIVSVCICLFMFVCLVRWQEYSVCHHEQRSSIFSSSSWEVWLEGQHLQAAGFAARTTQRKADVERSWFSAVTPKWSSSTCWDLPSTSTHHWTRLPS